MEITFRYTELLFHSRYCATRNLMSHQSSSFLLNVLKEHWSLSKFRSTLGHKANHSFIKANAIYVSVIHPRHGPIKAVLSIKRIKKGQEILCNYDYPLDAKVPSWYSNTYKIELNKEWPVEQVFDETDDCKPVYLKSV